MTTACLQPDRSPTKARQKATRPRSIGAALAFVGDLSVICRFLALQGSARWFPSSSQPPTPLLSGLSVLSVASWLRDLRQRAEQRVGMAALRDRRHTPARPARLRVPALVLRLWPRWAGMRWSLWSVQRCRSIWPRVRALASSDPAQGEQHAAGYRRHRTASLRRERTPRRIHTPERPETTPAHRRLFRRYPAGECVLRVPGWRPVLCPGMRFSLSVRSGFGRLPCALFSVAQRTRSEADFYVPEPQPSVSRRSF